MTRNAIFIQFWTAAHIRDRRFSENTYVEMNKAALSKGTNCQKLRLDKNKNIIFQCLQTFYPFHSLKYFILWNISHCFILLKLPLYLVFQ